MKLVPSIHAGRQRYLLGLDAGTSAVKAVALTLRSGSPRLAASASVPVRDAGLEARGEAVAAALAAMHMAPHHILRLATAIGGPHVAVTQFQMPAMGARERRRALPWEARRHLPDDDRVFDWVVQEGAEGAGEARVLLASAPRAEVEAHREMLRVAGLDVGCVEPAPLALARACRRLRGEVPAQACVLLDLGAAGTHLAIGDDQGAFLARYLEVGLGAPPPPRPDIDLDPAFVPVAPVPEDAPSGAAGAPQADAAAPGLALLDEVAMGWGTRLEELVLETRRSIAFFASHNADTHIQKVIAAGGGAQNEDLVAALEAQLGIPTARFAYRGNQDVPRIEATHAVAYGLAVKLAS